MNVIDVIIRFLKLSAPFIIGLVKSKVVPKAKRKAYELLDTFVDERIHDLIKLVEKAKNEKDGIKKDAHIEGLRLGIATLQAICDKLEVGLGYLTQLINADCLTTALTEQIDIDIENEVQKLADNIKKEVSIV
jgi:hypothetical protein